MQYVYSDEVIHLLPFYPPSSPHPRSTYLPLSVYHSSVTNIEFLDSAVRIGQQVVVTCTVASSSRPGQGTIYLRRPNGPSFTFYWLQYYQSSSFYSYTYTIRSVGLQHEGEYCCNYDSTSLCATLDVYNLGECCNIYPGNTSLHQ